MPRYDDRYSKTRLYVGRLSSRTRSRDLDRLFSRYGRVRDVDMKYDYAFVDFSDPRDADDARYSLDGREFDGSRLIVEFAKGTPRGSREYVGRGPPPGSGRCFNCGLDGHWARDCKAGDWKNKCYRCGERGHIERNCQNSPKKTRPRRSYSRSPSRGRNRSPSYSRSRSRSYSRSRSPPRRERMIEREEKRSMSHSMSPEPKKGSPPLENIRSRSPTPEEELVREKNSPSPKRERQTPEQDGSEYSESPRANSKSPERDQSPSEANGRGSSASPYEERRHVDDGDDDMQRSPRGSESP